MILFHGSDTVIERPELSVCKPFKDFGRGFYLSAERVQAEQLAYQRSRQTLKGIPVVNQRALDKLVRL